jgi:7-cyano-7-deazaguanine synthase
MEIPMNQLSANKALVILSGGQDSTTCLFWAKERFKEVHAVTFDYGQTHAEEIRAAARVGCLADVVTHHFVQLGPVLESTSPLTDPTQPLETYTDFDSMDEIIGDRVEKTFVPMRNALFLVLAANRAVALGCGVLVTGVCQADNANYPDCREDFIRAMEDTIDRALGQRGGILGITTPLMHLTKAESIRLALEQDGCYAALAFTHTAYDGKYPPTGSDHASVLRAHGFFEAGMPDPLVIRAVMEGKMGMPPTTPYLNEHQIHLIAQNIHRLKGKLGMDLDLGTTLGFPMPSDDDFGAVV